jgi:hypothetical protein
MIELAALSRDRLRQWLVAPSDGPWANRNVIGISVGYDETFVQLVDRSSRSHPDGSVEHSAVVASRLAAAEATLGGRSAESIEPDWAVAEALRQWRRISERRYGRPTTPLRIEISVDVGRRREREPELASEDLPPAYWKSHERKVSSDEFESTGGIPVSVRFSRGARLQLAASGGRLRTPLLPRHHWGTLGGFLRTASGQLFAMTAAHVVDQGQAVPAPALPSGVLQVVASPAFPAAFGAIRRALQAASLRSGALGAEIGRADLVSLAHELGRGECQFQVAPETTGGLDYAIAAWPHDAARNLTAAPAIELGEVSQVLKARFVGARSGRVNVRVTRYSVWHAYDLDRDGKRVACIADCFEVALDERPYVRTDVSQGGDSGAWLVCDGAEGPRWLGLLVGGDGERTGVVPAYRIRDDLRRRVGGVTSMI